MNTRRSFLKQTSAASALMFLSPRLLFSPSADTMIGLQLYSVKEDAMKDIDATLRHIAEVGYNNVELFGYNKRMYFGKTVSEMKAMLDKYKLVSKSGHYGLGGFLFNNDMDELKAVIEDAKILGHDYITVPWLDADKRSVESYKMLAEKFNQAGEACKKAGIGFAYHNHDFEFQKQGDTCGLEILLKNTQKDLVSFELDLYWVVFAGEKPADWFKKYPGRFPMWHVKDMAAEGEKASTEIGKGTIDFKDIFRYKNEAGFRYFFVEQEEFSSEAPAEAIKTSFKYIKNNLV